MTTTNDAVTETLARVNDTLAEMQKTQEAAVAASRKVDAHAADPDAHGGGGGAGAGVEVSDAVNSASSTTAASSKAVKTAYDKAVAAQTTASSALTKAEQALSGGGAGAGAAAKLATPRGIDGVNFDGSANITHYAVCSTAAATAAKAVSLSGFTLATGAEITVRFSATNTAANPTLNVNGTGAKPIQYRNVAVTAGVLAANRTYRLVYDGSSWELVGDLDSVQTSVSGNAGTATRLAAARSVRINLASQAAANFDGSANITPGVSGTLSTGNGGTGRTDGKAVALATPRTITLTGAVTGSVSFDGSKNVSLATVSGGGLDAGKPQTQVYTGNATFTVPPNITKLLVVCIGAGGNGVCKESATGGTGGAAASVYVTVKPGQQIPVTVGTPSSRTSSFGTFLSCSDKATTSLSIQMQSKAGNGGGARDSSQSLRQNQYAGGGGGGFKPSNWYTFAIAGPSFKPTDGTMVHMYGACSGGANWNITFSNGGKGDGNGANGQPVRKESFKDLSGSTSTDFVAGDGGGYGGGGGSMIFKGYSSLQSVFAGAGAPGAVVVLW